MFLLAGVALVIIGLILAIPIIWIIGIILGVIGLFLWFGPHPYSGPRTWSGAGRTRYYW